MAFFEQGIKILSFFAFVLFSILFFLTYNWTAPHGFGEKRNARAAFAVTIIYTFQFFLIGTLIIGAFYLVSQYLSDLLKMIGPT